tara:strand:+ start:153 stop:509 length:357 start_codon:yes stop_codon:yes gene_type:complete
MLQSNKDQIMSKVLRISADVFERLEANVTGFESPSEVIERVIKSHEEIEVIKLVTQSVISAEEFIKETGERKKTILLHQPTEAIENTMDYISTIFPQYNISHEFLKPGLKLIIKSKKK